MSVITLDRMRRLHPSRSIDGARPICPYQGPQIGASSLHLLGNKDVGCDVVLGVSPAFYQCLSVYLATVALR
jgi:hypothetical protein